MKRASSRGTLPAASKARAFGRTHLLDEDGLACPNAVPGADHDVERCATWNDDIDLRPDAYHSEYRASSYALAYGVVAVDGVHRPGADLHDIRSQRRTAVQAVEASYGSRVLHDVHAVRGEGLNAQ